MCEKLKYAASIALALVAFACHRQYQPEKVLNGETCSAIYAALMEVNMKNSKEHNMPLDSALGKNKQEIFAKYGTTEEAFRVTLRSYGSDVGKWKELFEGVVQRLEAEAKEKNQQTGTGSNRALSCFASLPPAQILFPFSSSGTSICPGLSSARQS